MVIPQKLREKVRLKYRFTRLDKYFSTINKGGRRYTLSGEFYIQKYLKLLLIFDLAIFCIPFLDRPKSESVDRTSAEAGPEHYSGNDPPTNKEDLFSDKNKVE